MHEHIDRISALIPTERFWRRKRLIEHEELQRMASDIADAALDIHQV